MARLLSAQHNAAEALPYAQKAVSRRRHYPAGLYLLAQIYKALGQQGDADKVDQEFKRESDLAAREKALLRRFNLDPKDLGTAFELGQVEIARERPAEALLFLRDAAQRAPDDLRIKAAIEQAEKQLGPKAAAAGDNPSPVREPAP